MPQSYWYPQNGYCTSNTSNTSATTNYVPMYSTQLNWNQATILTNTSGGNYYRPLTLGNSTIQTTYTYSDEVWRNWTVTTLSPNATWEQVVETPQQQAERRFREEQRQVERVAARTRARVLLEEFLNDEQKVELEQKGRFHITGSRGRRYCIRASGQSGNVDLLKPDGSLQAQLCAHPRGYLPDGDAWLMQMIEIRNNEDHFLRTANVHRGALPAAA